MKMLAEPRRYQGLMLLSVEPNGGAYTTVMIMHTANARFMERYFGAREEMSLPAGRTFSKVHLG